MTSNTKTLTLLLLSIALAALTGGVLATANERAPVLDARAVAPTIEVEPLVKAMTTLADELARLRVEVAAAGFSHAPSSERAPAVAGTSSDRLAIAVERLVERLSHDELGSVGDAAGSRGAPAFPALPADPARASESLTELRGKPEAQRLRDHILQTPRQILERYGVPSSVYTSPEGELNFVYQRDESDPQVGFTFADGAVVRVWGQ